MFSWVTSWKAASPWNSVLKMVVISENTTNACVLGAPRGLPGSTAQPVGAQQLNPLLRGGGFPLSPVLFQPRGVRSFLLLGQEPLLPRTILEADRQTQTILWKHLCHFAVSQVSNPTHGTPSVCSLLWFKQFLWSRSKKLKNFPLFRQLFLSGEISVTDVCDFPVSSRPAQCPQFLSWWLWPSSDRRDGRFIQGIQSVLAEDPQWSVQSLVAGTCDQCLFCGQEAGSKPRIDIAL